MILDILKTIECKAGEDTIAGIMRDGFVFTSIDYPFNVNDAIVIYNPMDLDCGDFRLKRPNRSLEEHIELINRLGLSKAYIIGENLDFITQCPTLQHLMIVPKGRVTDGFDYSPLYEMPKIKNLNSPVVYESGIGAEVDQYSTVIDYSKIKGIEMLCVSHSGHKNYSDIKTLKGLSVDHYQKEDLSELFSSEILDTLVVSGKIKTLNGIEKSKNLQYLSLVDNRMLSDIHALKKIKATLKVLRIDHCPKITDFSVLNELNNLVRLELYGNNQLQSLDFIYSMPKLERFIFDVNIKDGNLIPCLNVKYVGSIKNRRYYNLRNKDLPCDNKAKYGNEDIEEWRRLR